MKSINILAACLVTLAVLTGCELKTEPINWVDLRYDIPQDAYTIDKDGTQTVSIRIRSTDPWTVYGKKAETWYTITPDSGDTEEIYTVTITCEPNTSLDDRCDTIVVKSDYWIGKEFLLTQKGTAYLDFEKPDSIEMAGTSISLNIAANQDWSAKVTSGEDWLQILSGSSSYGDNSITLQAKVNSGEQRVGEVTLYDRHGVTTHMIPVTQLGVVLLPDLPENGKFFTLDPASQELRINVEANSSWSVTKKNPEEETWYEITGTGEYTGTSELAVNVSEYAKGGGAAVREGTLVLSTVTEDGSAPIVKTIRFKQASPDENRTQANDGMTLDSTGLTSEEGLPVGRYTFHLAPFTSDDCIYLYFFWQKDGKSFAELRFWLNTAFAPMKTELSCMPYCNDVNKWQSHLLVKFDSTMPVKIALDIKESIPDASGKTWIYSEWWLNDQMIAKATSDGIADSNRASDTWKIPFADISIGGYFRIWAFNGSATLDKWEYTSPVIWGE